MKSRGSRRKKTVPDLYWLLDVLSLHCVQNRNTSDICNIKKPCQKIQSLILESYNIIIRASHLLLFNSSVLRLYTVILIMHFEPLPPSSSIAIEIFHITTYIYNLQLKSELELEWT